LFFALFRRRNFRPKVIIWQKMIQAMLGGHPKRTQTNFLKLLYFNNLEIKFILTTFPIPKTPPPDPLASLY
jgi:hypothetical protein